MAMENTARASVQLAVLHIVDEERKVLIPKPSSIEVRAIVAAVPLADWLTRCFRRPYDSRDSSWRT